MCILYLRHNEKNADRMIRNVANKHVCVWMWVCAGGGDVHTRDRCSLARVFRRTTVHLNVFGRD